MNEIRTQQLKNLLFVILSVLAAFGFVIWANTLPRANRTPIPTLDGHRFIIGGNGYELIHDSECPKCKEEQP